MKFANRINISVFIKPEEDEARIAQALRSLLPFSLEEQKLSLKRSSVQGFSEKKIIICELELKKESHTNAFLKRLNEKLTEQQKDMLVLQDNRLDDECCFYLRLDKQRLLEGKYSLTDSGECYHIKMCIAAFPKKRECAKDVVRKIFME